MVEVSVIIPTYNRANLVQRAVDSALSQSLTNIEVIVADDGSTDETQAVIESISDPRLQYVAHEKNRGGSAARNTGINASDGEYVAFLDDDDQWHPQKLELQIDELESREECYGAVYCDYKNTRNSSVVNAIDKRFDRNVGIEGGEEILDHVLLRKVDFGGASTLTVERELIERLNGFDERFPRYQDIEFLVRLLRISRIAFCDDELVYKHDTSPNRSLSEGKYAVELFQKKFKTILKNRGLYTQVKRQDRFMMAKACFAAGEFSRGMSYLKGSRPPHYRDLIGLPLSLYKGIC